MINEWWIYQYVMNVQSLWGAFELKDFLFLSPPPSLFPSLLSCSPPASTDALKNNPIGKWQSSTLHTKMSNWVICFIFFARKGCTALRLDSRYKGTAKWASRILQLCGFSCRLMTLNGILALSKRPDSASHNVSLHLGSKEELGK